jgi:reactive intermediate/imine deaminase
VAEAAGGSLADIVRVGIYVTDLANFATVNAVMADYFKEPYPARSTIQVSALPKGAEVEVDAVMVIG